MNTIQVYGLAEILSNKINHCQEKYIHYFSLSLVLKWIYPIHLQFIEWRITNRMCSSHSLAL